MKFFTKTTFPKCVEYSLNSIEKESVENFSYFAQIKEKRESPVERVNHRSEDDFGDEEEDCEALLDQIEETILDILFYLLSFVEGVMPGLTYP